MKKRSHDYGYSSSYSNNYGSSYGAYSGKQVGKWSGIGDLIVLAVIGIVIYALYKTCLTGQEMGDRQYRWIYKKHDVLNSRTNNFG